MDRRNIPPPYDEPRMMRRGPLPPTHHPMEPLPPPELLENKLASQAAEIEQLTVDNRKLAASYSSLTQDLAAAKGEAEKINEHIRNIQNEGDIQIRILLDKIAKSDADIGAANTAKKELQTAHSEARKLMIAKLELSAKLEQATEELDTSHENIKKIPEMRAELDSLRREHQRLRMNVRWPRLLTPTHLSQIIRSQKNPLKALDIFNEAKTRYPSYRHNGPVYATMIQILGSSGRLTEMNEIIAQMKKDSCECQDSLFAGIIRTYANAGLFDEAVSLFNSLPEFNCVNYTVSFNTLLEIMVKESKLETCYHFFVENCCGWEIKSRLSSLKLLISALCQIRRSDLALNIFQEMEYQWCYPDRDTYRVLMKGLCEDGRLNEATHLLYSMFWRISQKGCGADVSVYRTLLESLCDNGQIEDAVELLETVLLKGLRVPKRYFKKLDVNQFYGKDNIKSLINDSLIRGGIRSSDGFNAMAIDFYSEGNMDEADKVLKEMHKKGFKPSLAVYQAKTAALFEAGKVDDAVNVVNTEMIENNCVPTVRLHNIVIRGLCSVKESDRAIEHLEKMSRQIGCVPDKETYTYLIDGLCCVGKYIEASRMLEKMLIQSYWPGEETYNKLIKGLCLMGRTYRAVVLLEEMIDQGKIPHISVWYSLVSSVCCEKHHAIEIDHL